MIKVDVDFATLAQLCTALATLLGVVGGILVSWSNRNKLAENTELTQRVHASTNGRLDSIVEAVQAAADAATAAAEAAKAHVPPKPPQEPHS